MQCAEHGPSRQNAGYARDHSHRILGTCLPDPGEFPDRHDTYQQPSFGQDWMNEYQNSSYQNELCSSDRFVAYELPMNSQFSVCNQYQLNEFSAQSSSLYDNESLVTQRSIHEALPSSTSRSFYNSPSVQSSSSNDSPLSPQASQTYPSHVHYYGSSLDMYGFRSDYGALDQGEDLRYKLQELETALLGPDNDDAFYFPYTYEEPRLPESSDTMQEVEVSSVVDNDNRLDTASDLDKGMICLTSGYPVQCQQEELDVDISTRDVRKLLLACAKAIADNDTVRTNKLFERLNEVVSVSGEPIERLGAYMLEGLVAKLKCTGSSIYKRLVCKKPTSKELLSYMQKLYELCPYFKFGYTSANGAIAEAFRDEDKVHIIDFQIAMGSQWFELIQALAKRPRPPSHIRITGIDDPDSEFARGGGLEIVERRLASIAEKCNVSFEFNPVPVMGADVQVGMLGCRAGEALAVNFPFQLHHMPDESVSTCNHRDRILRMVKGLCPKVVTLVEQEANTNTAPFFPRFKETLNYYTAMFESLDGSLPRSDKDRIHVETHCLARDIVNVIACEGAERVERHELMGKWKSRFMMAGFKQYPLSAVVNTTIKNLLQNYSPNYRYFEKDLTLYLGWLDRDLVTASAWH